MDVRRLHASDMPMVESLTFNAELTDGVIELTRADLGIAGGHVVGSFTLDRRREPPSARATINARDVRIEQLFPSVRATADSAGALSAHVELAGQGNSIASADGQRDRLVRGACGQWAHFQQARRKTWPECGENRRALFPW
jgi:uncharacterized protein involved in outer membrane biogenesis